MPYFSAYAVPAPPKYWAAIGACSSHPCSAVVRSSKRVNGLGRSLHIEPSAPRIICSNPSAITQSAAPVSIACRAKNSADEPVEQLLLTLTIGIPVWPSPYNAACPDVESP